MCILCYLFSSSNQQTNPYCSNSATLVITGVAAKHLTGQSIYVCSVSVHLFICSMVAAEQSNVELYLIFLHCRLLSATADVRLNLFPPWRCWVQCSNVRCFPFAIAAAAATSIYPASRPSWRNHLALDCSAEAFHLFSISLKSFVAKHQSHC